MSEKFNIKNYYIDLEDMERQVKESPYLDELTKYKLLKEIKEEKKKIEEAKKYGKERELQEQWEQEYKNLIGKEFIIEEIEVEGRKYRKVYEIGEDGKRKPV